MVRGLERRKIFLSEADRKDLLRRFSKVLPKTGARLYAWSFLTNHAHLLIRTGPVGLSSIMRKMLTGYASSFNRRQRRSGHLFQNRYKSILVEEEPYLLELVRYIHLNPFRAGLVEDLKQLESYRWSGHSALLGKIDRPWQDCRYILRQWGKSLRKARLAYRRFVIEGMPQGRRRELMGGGLIRSMGGWARVEELRRGRESWAYDERVLGGSDFIEAVLKEVGRRDERSIVQKVGAEVLSALAEKIGLRLGLSRAELMGGSRRRRVVEGRILVSYVAIRGYGTSLTQVAKVLNISVQSVLRGMDRGEEEFQKRGWTVADFIQ
jgi:REP element-mobilizing transposase RayT